MHILVVEDDRALSESLVEILESQNYQVDQAFDGDTAWYQINAETYDLLLLDLNLPGLDGLSLCQRLRSVQKSCPVLMLTARDTSHDKVRGLDVGADAYMVKPFSWDELNAQIRALLRRNQTPHSAILTWGFLSLNPLTYEVRYQQTEIRLTPKEFSILQLLMQQGRRVLSRQFIVENVWDSTQWPSEAGVKSHLKALRAKLTKAGAPQDFIRTVHGVGYQLHPPSSFT
ncbi:MAG: response regulator transcription factor [Prochlorotrichaceae cyanobacterium]|jgi:DNA-binding response OmpR family regulator